MMNHDMYSSKLENRTLASPRSANVNPPDSISCLYKFKDIEDLISLAYRLPQPFFDTKILRMDGLYYLAVLYPEQRMVRGSDSVEGLILEFGERTQVTIHRLEEYGRVILAKNAIARLRNIFAPRIEPTSVEL